MKRKFLSNVSVLHQKVFKKIQYQLMKICQFLTMVNIFVLDAIFLNQFINDCVHYIFAGLFFMTKREHSWSKEEVFLFQLESSFRSWDNQILYFEIFKCYDVIKCQHETRNTFYWIIWEVNRVWKWNLATLFNMTK